MMGFSIIGTGFIMGAVGSLHCIGMCGPLAFALPIGHRSCRGRLAGGALYNAGRISTYTLLGLFFGTAGQLVISTQWQSTVSLLLGGAILLYLLLPSGKWARGLTARTNLPFLHLRKMIGSCFASRKYSSLFSIGILNGLLPCGMVYLALSSSLLTGSAFDGGLFMAAFGLGTFPAMFAAAFFGSFMNQQLRLRLRKAVPLLLFIMAALLIVRGLNLDIPYLSPALHLAFPTAGVSCH